MSYCSRDFCGNNWRWSRWKKNERQLETHRNAPFSASHPNRFRTPSETLKTEDGGRICEARNSEAWEAGGQTIRGAFGARKRLVASVRIVPRASAVLEDGQAHFRSSPMTRSENHASAAPCGMDADQVGADEGRFGPMSKDLCLGVGFWTVCLRLPGFGTRRCT